MSDLLKVGNYQLHEDGWWWPETSSQKDWDYYKKKNKSLQFILKLVEDKVIQSRSVIQGGGCYGLWPKMLAKIFDNVYTYEPEANTFYGLCLNCPEENITKINAAMGHKRRPVTVQKKGFASHHVIGTSTAGNALQIPVDSLEVLNCDALILDIEGYELYALQGAKDTLHLCRPVVLVEDNGLFEKFHGLDKKYGENCVDALLQKSGYKLVESIEHDKIYFPKELK